MEVELKKPIVNHYTNADHVESNELLYAIARTTQVLFTRLLNQKQ